jgi:Bacteriophage protein gp37
MKNLDENKKIDGFNKTHINWTDLTWNPWTGCSKVSAGCKFCYIDNIEIQQGKDPKVVKRTSKMIFEKPLKVKTPSIIFTCSMSDFFHPDADQWREEAWEIIRKTPHHKYQILTKRPERIKECLPDSWCQANYKHVWLGVSVENNEPDVIDRIRILRQVPCEIRFISFEPLLDDIKLEKIQLEGIHWGIIGGESGKFKNGVIPQFRESKPQWFRNLRDILRDAGILIWFKQTGTFMKRRYNLKSKKGDDFMDIAPDLRLRERPDLNSYE